MRTINKTNAWYIMPALLIGGEGCTLSVPGSSNWQAERWSWWLLCTCMTSGDVKHSERHCLNCACRLIVWYFNFPHGFLYAFSVCILCNLFCLYTFPIIYFFLHMCSWTKQLCAYFRTVHIYPFAYLKMQAIIQLPKTYHELNVWISETGQGRFPRKSQCAIEMCMFD